MGESDRQDRERYLEKHFPRPALREWHTPGLFAERMLGQIENPLRVTLRRAGPRYVIVDAIELGGPPYNQQIRIRFRLGTELPGAMIPRWDKLDEPLVGSKEPVYYFTFTSRLPPEANIQWLQEFVAEHLDDELVESAMTVSPHELPYKLSAVSQLRSIRNLLTDAYFFLGVIGLAALAIYQAFQHIYGIALILGAAAVVVLGLHFVLRSRFATTTKLLQAQSELAALKQLTRQQDVFPPAENLPDQSYTKYIH